MLHSKPGSAAAHPMECQAVGDGSHAVLAHAKAHIPLGVAADAAGWVLEVTCALQAICRQGLQTCMTIIAAGGRSHRVPTMLASQLINCRLLAGYVQRRVWATCSHTPS